MYKVYVRRWRLFREPRWDLRAMSENRDQAFREMERLAVNWNEHVQMFDRHGNLVSEIIPA